MVHKVKKRKIESPKAEVNASNTKIVSPLPSVECYFNTNVMRHYVEELSEEEEEENDENEISHKKRKPSSAARKELVRKEEELLRKKEQELLTSISNPQSAEQFDRTLLGNPNSSELWTRYMAFHISHGQLELARSTARRALQIISGDKLDEKCNVWIALLHFENNFGDSESFNSVFEAAVQCNDSLKIYIDVIEMLSKSNKLTEMDEKIRKAKFKFKQELTMWIAIEKVLYKLGHLVEARHLKDSALKTIESKRDHMTLIVQCAILEFIYGEQEVGEALFETLLQFNLKRTDIWITYVDQLIKKRSYETARRVLHRAVGQKLPFRKMKTLVQKFEQFEQQFGNAETKQHVQHLIKNTMKSISK